MLMAYSWQWRSHLVLISSLALLAGVRARATELAAAMAEEDGVGAALAHFERAFPRHSALCDVSLLLEKPQARASTHRIHAARQRSVAEHLVYSTGDDRTL